MDYIWLIPLFPLVGAIINGLLAPRLRLPEKLIGAIAALMITLSLMVSVMAVWQYAGWSHQAGNEGKPYIAEKFKYTWLPGGKAQITEGPQAGKELTDLNIEWSYQLDRLSSLYILFITFVGLLIHIYAIGYMHGEAGFARFFAYLNLFMFMMLTLVLSSNLLMLFVGWEGVGLCSYLLIGFYMTRAEAANASKKAFIINRIGDAGFLLATAAIFAALGSIQFTEVDRLLQSYQLEPLGSFGLMSWIALGLFIGAIGKSAQIPLYIWLPDAMAGPTPVSALIHAATMVTAGVFLLARMHSVFQHSLTVMLIVAFVGALTALLAASIAITQRDIKKVLAYSTVSQLGLMFLGCGVGAFTAAIFHVVTHAFFKAQLFLGAGSIGHALHHEQDLMRMGGLKKYLPTTYRTMQICWLAICGIVPFAGFWSKDEIFAATFTTPQFNAVRYLLWFIGLVTAALTAFYMTRMMSLAFEGNERFNSHSEPNATPIDQSANAGQSTEDGQTIADNHHSPAAHSANPQEGSALMRLPLLILAAGATVIGFIGIPGYSWIEHWLAPTFQMGTTEMAHPAMAVVVGVSVVSLVVALVAIMAAKNVYERKPEIADKLALNFGPLYKGSLNHWYWDSLIEGKFVQGFSQLCRLLWQGDLIVFDTIPNGTALLTKGSSLISRYFDYHGVDLIVNFTGLFLRFISVALRTAQTGFVNNYALIMILGLCLIILGLEYTAIVDIYHRIFPSAGSLPLPGLKST